jgi:peptidoglycan/LPS O-acetylase OafA/YrhL
MAAFVLGIVLYLAGGTRLRRKSRRWLFYVTGFIVSVAGAVYCGTGMEVAPVAAPSILGVGFVLLVKSLHGWIRSVIANPLAVFLGRISYSVYIIHFLILDLIVIAFRVFHVDRTGWYMLSYALGFTLAVTTLFAMLSKRLVEDPGIALGHRLSNALISRHADRLKTTC